MQEIGTYQEELFNMEKEGRKATALPTQGMSCDHLKHSH